MVRLDKKSDDSLVYRLGKEWIFAGLFSASVLFTLNNTVAHADTTVNSPVATEEINTPKVSQPQSPTTPQEPNEPRTPEDTTPKEPSPNASNHDSLKLPSEEVPKESSSVHTATMELPTPKPTSRSSLTSPTPRNSQPVVPTTSPAPVTPVTPKPQEQVAPSQSINDWMPNKILQKMVAKTMGIEVSQITKDNIATDLTSLVTAHDVDSTAYIDGQTPFSLEGLQHATGLTLLDLSYSNDTDYNHLQYLPTGSGAYGDIVDLTPLAGLTNLTTLNVSRNKIVSLKPLAGLKKLTTLNVMYNWIGDFSMLNAKQITSLKLSHQNFVVDYAQQKFVDQTTHTITVAPMIRLPQNYDATLDKPSLFNPNAFKLVETQLQQIHTTSSPSQGHQIFSLYYSGMGPDDYAINTDGSTQFTNIKPQQLHDYTQTYDAYPNAVGIATPGNHQYYLRADLWSSKMDRFTILIPYDNAKKAAAITVQYRGEADNTTAIKPDLTFGTDKMVGDTYTLAPDQLAIDGYTYDDARNQKAAITGTFSNQAKIITLYYKKDTMKPVTPPVTPASTVTVTVHYQDEQGKQLLTDVKLTGQPGTSYHVTTPTLTGYQLTSASNPTGTFGNHDQTITVTYHQLSTSGGGDTSSTSETPDISSQPDTIKPVNPQQVLPTPGNGAATISVASKHPQRPTTAPKDSKPTTLTEQSQPVLPQTSEHRTSPLIGLGFLLASLIGITTRFRKRN